VEVTLIKYHLSCTEVTFWAEGCACARTRDLVMKKIVIWILFCISLNALANAPLIDESKEQRALVSAYWVADGSGSKMKNQLISAAHGDVNRLYKWLKQGPIYSANVAPGILELQRTARGGVSFPYVLVVPETYDAHKPIAVEFVLHGAVSRARWGAGGKWWNKGKGYETYLQRDQITVFPAAWRDAIWWSDAQADNLVGILRALKATYNVDDNRVYLSGVSDGGTGTYFFAFKQPSEWAAFLPYIGHMAVLTLKSEVRVGNIDIENLLNSAFFIVNGEKDRVYPARSVVPFINILEKSKINHVFTLIENGGHDIKWMDGLQPKISAFKAQQLRDPLPEKVRWMSDRVDKYERIHWLKIDKLTEPKKTGWISALRKGNSFRVLTQAVAEFSLLLNPEEVDFTQPILVTLNGKTVFNGIVLQDVEVLFKWAKNRDRSQLFTAELIL
jgi:predicted esterase